MSVQYNSTIVSKYFRYIPNPKLFTVGCGFVRSSSRGKNNCNILRRDMAVIVHASECMPGVSESISIINPIKKAKVRVQFVDNVNGRRTIKYINTNGTAILNKQMLLKIIMNSAFIDKKMLYPKGDIISKLINKFNVIPMGF